MSATGRWADRRENDVYETPADVCEKALGLVSASSDLRILDMGAGSGAWGKAARRQWPDAHIEGIDLHEQMDGVYNVWNQVDATDAKHLEGQFDLVIGNPPFNLAEQFVHAGLRYAKPEGTVLYLLRLNFLEGVARRDSLWKVSPPTLVRVFSKRISFTGDGKTDATAYALFGWVKSLGPRAWFEGGWL